MTVKASLSVCTLTAAVSTLTAATSAACDASDNTEQFGLGGVTRIFRRDATKLGPAHPLEPFTLAFLDPPYRKGLAEKALTSARDGGWLTPGALIVVEEAADAGFKAPQGFEELERRQYDDTELIFLHNV